jgi:tryptophanyl-tRNA synthetase
MRVLSGIQPTGRFHLGNYFGAIRQYISLQTNEQAYYFIADLHALTTIRDPARLREFTQAAAVDLLALGDNGVQRDAFRRYGCRPRTGWPAASFRPAGYG